MKPGTLRRSVPACEQPRGRGHSLAALSSEGSNDDYLRPSISFRLTKYPNNR